MNNEVNVHYFLLPLPRSSSALMDRSTVDLSPKSGPGKMQRYSAMLHGATTECQDTPCYAIKRNVTVQYSMQ
eukprot:2596246-Pyramimonas_sp.AAC.1